MLAGWTVAVGFVIPTITGIGQVREQHLQHHALAFQGSCASSLDLHTLPDRATAAWRERAFTLDLNDTGAAISVWPQAIHVA